MADGDDLLIVEGDVIRLMGKIALKTVNADLSRELMGRMACCSRRPSIISLIVGSSHLRTMAIS
jgi:hypothetical protein